MKAKLSTTIRSALVAMLVVAGTLTAMVSPAAAATGCAWCEDRPPDYKILIGQYDWYTCADDKMKPVPRKYNPGRGTLWVDLYYSPTCRTVWAYTSTTVTFFIERADPYHINYGTLNRYYGNRPTWMIYDAGYRSHACFFEPAGGTHCTDWW